MEPMAEGRVMETVVGELPLWRKGALERMALGRSAADPALQHVACRLGMELQPIMGPAMAEGLFRE